MTKDGRSLDNEIEKASRTGEVSCEGRSMEEAFMILFAGFMKNLKRIEGTPGDNDKPQSSLRPEGANK